MISRRTTERATKRRNARGGMRWGRRRWRVGSIVWFFYYCFQFQSSVRRLRWSLNERVSMLWGVGDIDVQKLSAHVMQNSWNSLIEKVQHCFVSVTLCDLCMNDILLLLSGSSVRITENFLLFVTANRNWMKLFCLGGVNRFYKINCITVLYNAHDECLSSREGIILEFRSLHQWTRTTQQWENVAKN